MSQKNQTVNISTPEVRISPGFNLNALRVKLGPIRNVRGSDKLMCGLANITTDKDEPITIETPIFPSYGMYGLQTSNPVLRVTTAECPWLQDVMNGIQGQLWPQIIKIAKGNTQLPKACEKLFKTADSARMEDVMKPIFGKENDVIFLRIQPHTPIYKVDTKQQVCVSNLAGPARCMEGLYKICIKPSRVYFGRCGVDHDFECGIVIKADQIAYQPAHVSQESVAINMNLDDFTAASGPTKPLADADPLLSLLNEPIDIDDPTDQGPPAPKRKKPAVPKTAPKPTKKAPNTRKIPPAGSKQVAFAKEIKREPEEDIGVDLALSNSDYSD